MQPNPGRALYHAHAWDLLYAPMLLNQAFFAVSQWIMVLQLSVLRVFQAILSDKAFRKQEGSGEVIHLATHVTRNLFARLAPDNPYEGNITPLLRYPPAWCYLPA